MRNQSVTEGIVLSRTNFQEADRIITVLTPDQGKIRLMAKGVRRERSKLAGGIELFSISQITFLPGRKEIGTLISARSKTYFADITKDLARTTLGYEIVRSINRVTEDAAGGEYFDLLSTCLSGLNNNDLSLGLVELWFCMNLLGITGHAPNLKTDVEGRALDANDSYVFDHEAMAFARHKNGPFNSNHIKLLRLATSTKNPAKLARVKGTEKLADQTLQLAKSMLQRQVRI